MSDMNDDQKKLRHRNLALAGVLLLMVVIFFVVSVLKVQEGLNVSG
jgi:hypothetical protein